MTLESTSHFKFKISPRKIAAIFVILAIPFAIYLTVRFVLPINSWPYEGRSVAFRINLRAAQNVPIITTGPSGNPDLSIRNSLVRDDVMNITFLFKPTDDKNNTLYLLEESELIRALTFAYLYSPSLQAHQLPSFKAQIIDSYSNITANQLNPKIVLVHPNYSNQTLVRQDGYIVYVEAKNTNNFDTDKIQFDLATVRLMMAILSIKIS